MEAYLISIGDELLIGQTINTNVAWLGKELSLIGISVKKCLTIADDEHEILNAIDNAVSTAKLIIITGGLGPTKDDITKHTLCKYFDTTLEINEEVLLHVTEFFKQRNRPMLEANIQQAAIPKAATVLHNRQGTAAGMWFEKNGSIIISLPGVPYEMKSIMSEEAFPKILPLLEKKPLYHKTLLTHGIGESFLAEKIKDWEIKVRNAGFGLAYLPSPGMVKLRLSTNDGIGKSDEIDAYFNELKTEYPHYVFGENEMTLASVVLQLCTAYGFTLGVVESCTAGQLSAEIVSVSGASAYFMGGVVAYSNELKNQLVGVSLDTISKKGAVSEFTVKEMSEGGLKVFNTDFCLAISGVAGPGGGTEYNPVGSVWIGLSSKERTVAKHFQYGTDRSRNIQMAVMSALNMLRCEILKI